MKLIQWQEKYPDADSYYDAFHGSTKGQAVWETASEAMQEDWDEESDDEEPLIVAHDIVIDGMESWVLHDVEESEYDQASDWFETLRDSLSESVFGGLT